MDQFNKREEVIVTQINKQRNTNDPLRNDRQAEGFHVSSEPLQVKNEHRSATD